MSQDFLNILERLKNLTLRHLETLRDKELKHERTLLDVLGQRVFLRTMSHVEVTEPHRVVDGMEMGRRR